MYGIVVKRGNELFAAVSPYKRALKGFSRSIDESYGPCSAFDCNWRMRDKSGWIDGGPGAEHEITEFPLNAKVIW